MIWAVLAASGIVWALGAWEVYAGDATAGAIQVLVGGVGLITGLAWRRRDPGAGLSAILDAISEFFQRAR